MILSLRIRGHCQYRPLDLFSLDGFYFSITENRLITDKVVFSRELFFCSLKIIYATFFYFETNYSQEYHHIARNEATNLPR